MQFNILFSGHKLGVLPASALIQGSTDLGDVLNSFAIFVKQAFRENPDHPATALYAVMPSVINGIVVLADSFEVRQTPSIEGDFDGVVTFKGKEYYVLDYDTSDAQRSDVQLELRLKSLVDAEAQSFDDEDAAAETLEAILAHVQMYLNDAVLMDTERRNLKSVVTASPAVNVVPVTVNVASPALPTPPPTTAVAYTVASPKQVSDLEAARAALSALLRKGSL